MGYFLGLDPGGEGAIGWCMLESTTNQPPLRLVARGIADHADGAVAASLYAIGTGTLKAAGIDSPLFWRPDGDRVVDQCLRKHIVRMGAHSATVNAVNSMQGACLIQGMMAAMLLRVKYPQLRITESHPKALLWLLNSSNPNPPPQPIALSNLDTLIQGNVAGG